MFLDFYLVSDGWDTTITTFTHQSYLSAFYAVLFKSLCIIPMPRYHNAVLLQRRLIYRNKFIWINIYKRNETKSWEEEGRG